MAGVFIKFELPMVQRKGISQGDMNGKKEKKQESCKDKNKTEAYGVALC